MERLKPTVEFFIKKPTAKSRRKTFAIIINKRDPSLPHPNQTIPSKELDAINKLLKARAHDLETSERMARELLEKLRQAERPDWREYPIAEVNKDIFDWFWQEEYADRSFKDEDSRRNDFKRAIRAVGDLPLAIIGVVL